MNRVSCVRTLFIPQFTTPDAPLPPSRPDGVASAGAPPGRGGELGDHRRSLGAGGRIGSVAADGRGDGGEVVI